jgi:hypothetical protein
MDDAEVWLHEFKENLENPAFLKERINLPSWIHLSPHRLTRLLDQIDRKTGRAGSAIKGWPRIVERFRGTANADAMFRVLELGLTSDLYFPIVLELVIELISRPSLRLYLEPLLDDTLFVIRCPDSPFLPVLEYHLSFKWAIDKGVLPWPDIQKGYSDLVIRFQAAVWAIDPGSRLVVATIRQLNEGEFVERCFLEMDNDKLSRLKEEFDVSLNADITTTIMAFARILESPVNPIERIPRFLLPVAAPPPDLVFPHFDRHALSIEDAVIRVLLEKRYRLSGRILDFLDGVRRKLDPGSSVRFHPNAIPVKYEPVVAKVEDIPRILAFRLLSMSCFCNLALQSSKSATYAI